MQKKKEKFLEKIVKKNYNNELETVLENKNFDENTKSILLSMLYKLEAAYKDYEQVKRNVMSKDEFLQKIIDVIQNEIETIEIVKINSKEAEILEDKPFLVDKKNKKIICYPIERNLLYSISKISKKDKIVKDKYYVLNRTVSDLLLIGNNINTVEVIRDFNGFSWSVVTKDIESIEHNLIYQNLRILVGAEFLNKWIYNRESIIDNFEMFKIKLEELYGKEFQDNLIDVISKLSVLLEVKYNSNQIKNLLKNKEEVENSLKEIENKEEFIKKLTKEKKELNKQIKKIDTIISDKKLLQIEYNTRNESLPLDKKIFSMRVLSKVMNEERQELILKRENINKMLNPQKFIKYQNSLEEKYKYVKYIDEQDTEKKINDELIIFQKQFLECYKIKIERTKTREEFIDLLAQLRYYLNIPFSKKQRVNQLNSLKKQIEEMMKKIINKAIEMKVLIKISNDNNINYMILKELFNTKIINLQSININIAKENGKLFLQMFDENVFDERLELGDLEQFDLNSFTIKFNKTLKIFNA